MITRWRHRFCRKLPVKTSPRAAIFVALVLPTVVTWVYFIWLDGADKTLQQMAYGVGKSIQFALPIVCVFLIQRQRPNFALRMCGGKWLALGAAFGLAVGAAMAALYFGVLKPMGLFDEPARAVREKVQSFGAASPPAFILLGVFYSAIHSLLEEYYWRWFVFGQLTRQVKLPMAIGVSSFGFAAHHVLVLGHYFTWVSPLTWLFTACIVVGGGTWAWLYARSGSLLPSWLSHALVDAAIFAIGYGLIA